MQFAVLGPVEIRRDDGITVVLSGRRQRALLAVLLAHAGGTVSAGRLVDELWGDELPDDPAAALQSQVSRLRRLLGPPGRGGVPIVTAAAGYRLDAVPADAAEFDRLVRDAQRSHDPAAALTLLDSALALWRDPAYGELADLPEVRAEAVRLDELRLAAVEARAAALLTLDRPADAAHALAPHVSEHPLREPAVSGLVRALHAAGRTADALAAYRAFRDRLADELGLDPSPKLRELHLAVLRGEPATTVAPSPPPLPRPTTSFVGRDAEVAAVPEAMRRSRVVTLTGPGGVGKTRLALEAAARVAGTYPEGAWFCDLAAIANATAVAPTVASVLGVQQRVGRSIGDRIVEVLAGRRLLLLLDNCEHVRDAVAALVSHIVERTSDTHLLVTSREPLGVGGEQRLPVEPLPVPAPADVDAATDTAAVRLFVDRAAATRPGFALTKASDVSAVCAICREVDGLPLAVELAAARAAARLPAEIATDLAGRVDRLAARHTGLARHRSVRAVVDWSFDLLTPSERHLAEHLAVFASGCTPAAAAAVVGHHDATGDVTDQLVALVDRSLVVARPAGGTTRYAMLEPVRAVAEQRLRDRGRLAAARARHAAYFVTFAEQAATGLRGGDAAGWAEALDAELANIRAAHAWMIDAGGADGRAGTFRLLAALHWYAYSRMQAEVSWWAEVAVARYGDEPHPLLPAVLALAAVGACRRGDLARSRGLAERGAAAREFPGASALALEALGDIATWEGRLADARGHFTEARRRAAAAGDQFAETVFAGDLALVLGYTGDQVGAERAAADVLAAAERLSDPMAEEYAQYVAGEIRLERAPQQAAPYLRRAVELAGRAGDRFFAGVARLSVVSVEVRAGDPRAALADLGDLVDHWHRSGSWVQGWTTMRLVVEVLSRLGHDGPAAVLLGALRAAPSASPAYGADQVRLAAAETELRGRLGDAAYQGLIADGAALDGNDAMALARRTVAELLSGG